MFQETGSTLQTDHNPPKLFLTLKLTLTKSKQQNVLTHDL